MTDTVPAPTDNRSKLAGDLEPGDWIWHEDAYRQVTYTQPNSQTGRVRLVFHDQVSTMDGVGSLRRLASPAEQRAAADREARNAITAGLRDLATTIDQHRLPVPGYLIEVGVVLQSRAELDVWARAFGAEVHGGATHAHSIPSMRHEIPLVDGRVLAVRVQSPAEPPAAPSGALIVHPGPSTQESTS
ncbi:MAG TPA: hypothetical protein VFM54_14700 [Micromonosporaceae bacterium]|nr:hypothetical protein [Micromonosporaceae bacterium]